MGLRFAQSATSSLRAPKKGPDSLSEGPFWGGWPIVFGRHHEPYLVTQSPSDAVASRSSRVWLRTTYLSPTLRISRPMLDLTGAPSSSQGDGEGAIFVYARA